MQSSVQEVTMLFKLIAAAKDTWACYFTGIKTPFDLFLLIYLCRKGYLARKKSTNFN